MLILTRRVGETVMINDDIAITVLGVKGNQVRVGINAPKEISVHREEIYQKILCLSCWLAYEPCVSLKKRFLSEYINWVLILIKIFLIDNIKYSLR